jgi:hypothetical protein
MDYPKYQEFVDNFSNSEILSPKRTNSVGDTHVKLAG